MSDKQRKEEETSLEGRSSTAVLLRLVGSAKMHPTQKAVRPHYPHPDKPSTSTKTHESGLSCDCST